VHDQLTEIQNGLAKDIERTKSEITRVEQEKTKKIKEMLEAFEAQFKTFKALS
jgi:hypothetical protein